MVDFPVMPEMSIQGAVDAVKNAVANPALIAGIAGTAGAGAGYLAGRAIKKRKRKSKKRKKSSRRKSGKRKRKLKFGSKAYRKKYLNKHRRSRRSKVSYHKHRRNKGIHYTKKGQPYIILSSGKARFIKMSSASNRKKRKGGYY